jgi:hypothetical protein
MAGQSTGVFGFLGKKSEAEPEKGPIDVRQMRANMGKLPVPSSEGGFTWSDWPIRVKYRGMMELDGLYRFMVRWLKQRRYEFHETLYKYKPPELNIKWRAEKKKSGFVKVFIDAEFHIWGEYDIETIVNGKKKKMANVRFTLLLKPGLEAPYNNLFGDRRWNQPMERTLLRLFNEYVMKRDFEELDWDVHWYEVVQFQTAIKEYLKMEARGSAY